ncbi:hypothetical protein [uncultured Mucilaginibacter sp.]|uniref:hypothetical protein n=1 Tax=uncultured Mucilaginibacter sp. TaxID=797541 RepID=UPI0025EF6F60|nr:hypothetical protein [uncultured Mucilaginibacter sp.]
MKLKYLFIFLFLAESCSRKEKTTNILSLVDKWGVVCYFEPTPFTDQQRTIFLPLENPTDSSSITNKSSIFDFNYRDGIDFKDQGRGMINYKTYWISDHKKYLSEKDDTTKRVYWVFAKLKFHTINVQKKKPAARNIPTYIN